MESTERMLLYYQGLCGGRTGSNVEHAARKPLKQSTNGISEKCSLLTCKSVWLRDAINNMFIMVRHRSRVKNTPFIHLMDTFGIMVCARSLYSADDMNFFTVRLFHFREFANISCALRLFSPSR